MKAVAVVTERWWIIGSMAMMGDGGRNSSSRCHWSASRAICCPKRWWPNSSNWPWSSKLSSLKRLFSSGLFNSINSRSLNERHPSATPAAGNLFRLHLIYCFSSCWTRWWERRRRKRAIPTLYMRCALLSSSTKRSVLLLSGESCSTGTETVEWSSAVGGPLYFCIILLLRHRCAARDI